MERDEWNRSLERPGDWGRQPLLAAALAAMAGTVAGRHWEGWSIWGWSVALAMAAAWLVTRRHARPVSGLLVLASVAVAFAVWTDCRWNWFAENDLGLRADVSPVPVVMEAELLTAPRTVRVSDPWAPGMTSFSQATLRVLCLRDGRQWSGASGIGRLTVSGPLVQTWRAGDRLRVYGKLRRYPPPANPGEYPRAHFFRQRRQLFEVLAADESQLELLEPAPAWSLRRCVEQMRLAACRQLEQYVDSQWYPLAAALVLGARHLVDWQMLEPFLQTGTIHLLAISGLHLAMLVWGLFALLRLQMLGFRTVLCAACALVVLYAILTSGQPPVVRAAVLAIGICAARLMGRPYSVWNLWGAGALAVLLYNPLQLYDAGVQLSFLAVAALLSSPPPWHRPADPVRIWLWQARPRWQRIVFWWLERIASATWAGLVVWLVTLPLVVYRFHRASPVAILANPLLWLPVASALLSGIGVVATGAWCPPLAKLLGIVCTCSLKVTYQGILWFEELSGTPLWLASPPGFWIAWVYAWWFVWLISRWPVRLVALLACWAGGLASLWLVVLAPGWWGTQRGSLQLTFFAVGHGTCVLIELPGGQTLLYDAGRFGSPRPTVQYVSETLWARRIRRLDLVMISHADADHFNVLPGLLERVACRDVAFAQPLENTASPLARRLDEELARRRLPCRLLAQGEVLRFPGGVEVAVLHPPVGYRAESDNAASLVVRLRYAGRTVLLPGDLEGSGMERLLRQPPPQVDVAMSPHHASVYSNHAAWAQWVKARHMVVCDTGKLPEPLLRIYQQTGTRIWYTDQLGAVQVIIAPDGTLEINSFRGQQRIVESPPARAPTPAPMPFVLP
ncbi:MAG: competence protein ComEC [Pirellulaceae bacterium]|nr:MAG: competence protein ComEC [Pirellulaceae bacterium]